MATRPQRVERITAAAFLESLVGEVVNTSTDGQDVFMEFADGRVIMFSTYGGNIVMCQMQARPQTLQ